MPMPTQFEISVAASLGANPAVITTELINLPMYAPAALAELNKRYSGIGDIPDDNPLKPVADRAIIAATALRLLPYWLLNYPKVEQLPGSRVESFEPNWSLLSSSLEAELENALAELGAVGTEDNSDRFHGFRVTSGRRR